MEGQEIYRDAARKYAASEKGKQTIARYREANREKIRSDQAAYYLENKDLIRRRTQRRKYGAESDARGARALRRRVRRLVVDHDHATLTVRGAICIPCNVALAQLGDNEEGLQRAVEYVKVR